jgi:transposase
VNEVAESLVPEGLWEIAAVLIPAAPKRTQGGGRARIDDLAVFTAIVYVLTCGCAWRRLPPGLPVSHQTAHRRFVEWCEVDLWAKIHQAVLDLPGTARQAEWARAVSVAASERRRSESAWP